jgi:hypothetical protein
MRHYIAGRRDCPQWIVDKLPQVLAERAAELRAQAAACDGVAAELANLNP